MKRLTLIRGSRRQKVILEHPPYPEKGESVKVRKTGECWMVAKLEDCEPVMLTRVEKSTA